MRQLDSAELSFWLAVYRALPVDALHAERRFAMLACVTVNSNPWRDGEPAMPEDFSDYLDPDDDDGEDSADDEELIARETSWARGLRTVPRIEG